MLINKFKKIVIKIGSSILIDKKGKPKKTWLRKFVRDIKFLIKRKKQVVIVSSSRSNVFSCNSRKQMG